MNKPRKLHVIKDLKTGQYFTGAKMEWWCLDIGHAYYMHKKRYAKSVIVNPDFLEAFKENQFFEIIPIYHT